VWGGFNTLIRNMPDYLRNQTKHREITNKLTIFAAIKHNKENGQKEKLKRERVRSYSGVEERFNTESSEMASSML